MRPPTPERHDDDSTIKDHDRRIGSLERRQDVSETTLDMMAPKLEMLEMQHRLETKLQELSNSFATSHKSTDSRIQEMANTVKHLAGTLDKGMQRLNDVNEEQMQNAAAQAAEKHKQELELRDVEIKALKANQERAAVEAAERKWDKQIVRWGGICCAAMGIGAFIAWILNGLGVQIGFN